MQHSSSSSSNSSNTTFHRSGSCISYSSQCECTLQQRTGDAIPKTNSSPCCRGTPRHHLGVCSLGVGGGERESGEWGLNFQPACHVGKKKRRFVYTSKYKFYCAVRLVPPRFPPPSLAVSRTSSGAVRRHYIVYSRVYCCLVLYLLLYQYCTGAYGMIPSCTSSH